MHYIIVLLFFFIGVTQAQADSRCEETQGWWSSRVIECTHKKLPITVPGVGVYEVLYQTPLGEAPAEGWPVAFIYQGSFLTVKFRRSSRQYFGGFNEIRLIQELLDNGFAVVAPRPRNGLFWDTNTTLAPYERTGDYAYFNALFDVVAEGALGPLNPDRMYATGISSGGYNTSRMAVNFPGKFRALAIQSASYATCGGAMCILPRNLPEDHPPTLFLHGTKDWMVPLSSMERYYNDLYSDGVPVRMVTDNVGHQWLDDVPYEVVNWFLMNP